MIVGFGERGSMLREEDIKKLEKLLCRGHNFGHRPTIMCAVREASGL